MLVISNVHGSTPVITVKDWKPRTKEYMNKDWPNCITSDSEHMSGVDSSNALVGVYRIDVHCKK